MGSVQSQEKCSRCNFALANHEYYYKSGEVWLFCDRCGYNFSGFMKHDPAYGKKIKIQAEQLIKEGKIDDALKITGNTGWTRSCMVNGEYKTDIPISEWSDADKIKTIMDTRWNRFHKVDKDGKYVWDIESTGGYGSYHVHRKKGVGFGGSFKSKLSAKKTIRKICKDIKKTRNRDDTFTYTKKIANKWYIFNARTGKSANIPDDIDFELWLKLMRGEVN